MSPALLPGNLLLRRPWFNVGFNAAHIAVALAVAAGVYHAVELWPPLALAEPALRRALAVTLAAGVLFLLSALAVDIAAGLQQRSSPFANWLAVRGPTMAPFALLVLAGGLTATAIDRLPWLAVLLTLPTMAVRSLLLSSAQFDAEKLRVADDLAAAALGAGEHRRFADLATQLARVCNLAEEQCRWVDLAARLEPLALESADTALPALAQDRAGLAAQGRRAEIGAQYVSKVLGLPAVAAVLRYRYSSYDGRGYPGGLRGPDLPIESRVLSVAAAWLDLTAPPVGRPAVAEDQAARMLMAGAGTKWDPAVVHAALKLMTRRTQSVGGAAGMTVLGQATG
ncbi:MAG: hypothetical protein U0531_14295 [Dehalococcoidia bacterium]